MIRVGEILLPERRGPCIFNSIAADGLTMQRTRASTAMVLTTVNSGFPSQSPVMQEVFPCHGIILNV